MVTYDFGDEPNPWSEEHWNVTKQGAFLKRAIAKLGERFGTEKAQAFAAQAGTTLGALQPCKPPPYQVIVQKRTIVSPAAPTAETAVLGFNQLGILGAAQVWALPVTPLDMTFPASAPSQAVCAVAPTEDAELSLLAPDTSVLCVVSFTAGSMIGTFKWSSDVSVNAGEILSVEAQAIADGTWASVNIAFVGLVIP